MRTVALILALLCNGVALAAQSDDHSAVAAIVPSRISVRPWGWAIHNARGTTQVMRRGNHYVITTPTETFRLVRRYDGYAIIPAARGTRELAPDERYDLRVPRRHR